MSDAFRIRDPSKDVRNNPIVREVDDNARAARAWKSVAVATLVVVVLLVSATQHFYLLRNGAMWWISCSGNARPRRKRHVICGRRSRP